MRLVNVCLWGDLGSSAGTDIESSAVTGGILVVSEVFPPAIGGSGALLENVYRRVAGTRVRVLADEEPAGSATL